MKNWLIKFHANDRGQILPIALVGMFGMVLLLAYILNTGQKISDRTRVQNAADAAAMTQASWAARSLNVMSMNNVGMTQMFTVFMVSQAAAQSLVRGEKELLRQVQEVYSFWNRICSPLKAVPVVGGGLYAGCMAGPMAAITAVVTPAAAYGAAYEVYFRPFTHGLPTSLNLVRAFGVMNRRLVRDFPAKTAKIQNQIGTENHLSALHLYPVCDDSIDESSCSADNFMGSDLPVTNQGFAFIGAVLDICNAADKGTVDGHKQAFTEHGYPKGKGPYTAGGEGASPLLDHVNREPLFGFDVPGLEPSIYNWWRYIKSISGNVAKIETFGKYRYDGSGEFEKVMKNSWNSICKNTPSLPGTINTASKTLSATRPALGALGNIGNSIGGIIPDAFKPQNLLPGTYMLKGAVPGLMAGSVYNSDDLSVLTIAAQDDRYKMLNAQLSTPVVNADGDSSPVSYAFSQATVYNPISHDLYTQYWTARLAPISLLKGHKQQLTAELRDRSPFDFSVVRRLLDQATDDQLGWISVH